MSTLPNEVHSFQFLMEQMNDPLAIVDLELRYICCNSKFANYYGLSEADIIGKCIDTDNKNSKSRRQFRKCFSGATVEFDKRFTDRLGREKHYHIRLDPYWGPKNTIEGAIFSMRDISGISLNYQNLSEHKRRLKDMLQLAADLMFETDSRLRFTEISQNWLDLLKKNRGQIIGTSLPAALRSLSPNRDTWQELRVCLKQRQGWEGDVEFIDPADKTRVYEFRVKPFLDSENNFAGFRGAGVDRSLERDLARNLEYQALHDSLTMLPNRRAFERWINSATEPSRRRRERSFLAFMDLDGFKRVNDQNGHAAGDQLLISVAKILLDTLREDDKLARLGGDEFAVLCEAESQRDVEILASRLVRAVSEGTSDLGGLAIQIGVSIGLTEIVPGQSGHSAFQQADAACYAAKRAGKSRWCFAESSTSRLICGTN